MNEINRKNYHFDTTHISKSGLDLIDRSPLHYLHRYKQAEGLKRKRHFDIGTAAHTLILEPHLAQKDIAVIPSHAPKRPSEAQRNAKNPSPSTVAAVEFWYFFDREHAHRPIVNQADYDHAQSMRDAVMKHPAASQLLSQGEAEFIHTWQDPTTGVDMKMRADWVNGNIIADVKTTDDASPRAFARSARKWRYDVQSAVYTDGLKSDNFVFIAVEKAPPYAVAVYFATPDMINDGRAKRDANLKTYAEALCSGDFKAYSDIIEPMEW